MLYDPKWEVETRGDPMTLESLIAWLRTMPARGDYNWEDCEGRCLIGIYGRAMGLGDKWHTFHSQLFDRYELHIASETPHTFGAALRRARKALAARI